MISNGEAPKAASHLRTRAGQLFGRLVGIAKACQCRNLSGDRLGDSLGQRTSASARAATHFARERYAVVNMGAEMKDPQTGQSLGRMETACCELVIDRVTQNLSYGHLEGAGGTLAKLLPGALQVREQIGDGTRAARVAAAGSAATAGPGPAPARKPQQATKHAAPDPAPEAKRDDKW